MADGNLPDIETLRKLLAYDPETGVLTWRERPREMFATANAFGTWNSRYAGKPALTSVGSHGYRAGSIFYRDFLAHRVALAIVNGKWPPHDVDHINGDRKDNRLCNLRAATRVENCQNQRRRPNNTSGVTGVYWSAKQGKWHAQIKADGRMRNVGFFSEFAAAVAARKAAEAKYGFHENHGRE